MHTVNRTVAARAAGVPYTTLVKRRYQRDRKTAAPHREGTRDAEQWSATMVLAVRVCRQLEHRFHVPLAAMTDLFNVFWTADEENLRRMLASGRKFVMIVGATPVARMLFTEAEISRNDAIDYEAAAAAGLPLPVGLDIAAEYAKVIAAMTDPEAN